VPYRVPCAAGRTVNKVRSLTDRRRCTAVVGQRSVDAFVKIRFVVMMTNDSNKQALPEADLLRVLPSFF